MTYTLLAHVQSQNCCKYYPIEAFDKAVELVIETPTRLNSLTEDLPDL